MTIGLKRAGFKVIGAVDSDSMAIRTYKANHEDVYLWESDIRALKMQTVKRELGLRKGKLDLLAGCPPCQGFSTLRTKNGAYQISDPRNSLLMEFLRFVSELRPKAVMLENVPGLAGNEKFKTFRNQMKKIGYKDTCDTLDAVDYGIPQRRRRLVYLAALGIEVAPGLMAKKKRTVRDAIYALPPAGDSGDHVHDFKESRSLEVKKRISAIPKDGGSRASLPPKLQLSCHKKTTGFKDIYGRMAWDKPSPTITAGCFNPSKGRFLHPIKNRAITMREAALLQGFPKKYKFPSCISKCTAALLIGNALPPEFTRRHAMSLKRAIALNYRAWD